VPDGEPRLARDRATEPEVVGRIGVERLQSVDAVQDLVRDGRVGRLDAADAGIRERVR
jgi:hypothetical protein